MEKITIETIVHVSIEHAWETWTKPEHITKWCHASDDWETPAAENDVRIGGRFSTTMAAKDGSAQFDFTGTYTNVEPNARLEYDVDKASGEEITRHVSIAFTQTPEGVHVSETFDTEDINPIEIQRGGWQAILDNYKTYTESSM